MNGRGRKGGKQGGIPGRAGGSMAPPSMSKKPGSPQAWFSRTNNDGNLYTRKSPYKRERVQSFCFITNACVEAKGLPDDCYQLRLLELFREEYVKKLPEGEAVLTEYREKAPRVVEAIRALGEEEAAGVWEYLFEKGVARSVALITNGAWDEAYEVYRQICQEMEERFLAPEGSPGGPTGKVTGATR